MKTVIFLNLLFLVISPLFYGQKTITKKYYGSNVIEEQYQVNAVGQKNGFYKYFSSDGHLILSYNYKNDQEHGTCIDYGGTRNWSAIYCYGKPLDERIMENGVLKSQKYYGCANNTNYLIYTKKQVSPEVYLRTEYYQNGKVKEKYNENTSYTKDNGLYERYYENGKIAEKGEYKNGKFGKWLSFYENGDTMLIELYEIGVPVIQKKYYSGNKIEKVMTIDGQFENIKTSTYDLKGRLISERLSKTYPFKYDCGSSNDPNKPKNWRELAERRILCGGESYSPYDHMYTSTERSFDSIGQVLTLKNYELRVNKNKNVVAETIVFNTEDSLWNLVNTNNSILLLEEYIKNSKLKLYESSIDNMIANIDKKKDSIINLIKMDLERIDNENDNKSDSIFRLKDRLNSSWTNVLYKKIEALDGDFYDSISPIDEEIRSLDPKILKAMNGNKSDDWGGGSYYDEDPRKAKLRRSKGKDDVIVLYNQQIELQLKKLTILEKRKSLWMKTDAISADNQITSAILSASSAEEIFKLIDLK